MLQMIESFWFLFFTLVMSAHLACVNIAAVGPLFCIALEIRANRSVLSEADAVGKWLAHVCCKLLLAGIVLGLVLVGIKWLRGDDSFFMALQRIPYGRLKWGVAEIAFYFACMLPTAAFWLGLRQGCARWLHRLLAVLAATNLMYHFPPLFAVIHQLGRRGEVTKAIDNAEFLGLTMQPEVVAMVIHHLIAGIAITGVVVMVRSRRLLDNVDDSADERRGELATFIRRAAWTSLVASLFQIPVGIWLLLEIPVAARDQLLGGSDLFAILWFVLSMLAALTMLYALALVGLGEIDRKSVRAAVVRLSIVIVAMTALAQKIQ
jgi:hypothetical protein